MESQIILNVNLKLKKKGKLLNKCLETGKHRNVKTRKRARVTIPKKKYNRRFIREAMDVINSQKFTSSNTNQLVTTQELSSKGFSFKDVIDTANDLENTKRNKIKEQYTGNEDLAFDVTTEYSSAVDILHKYLHSFDLDFSK